LSPDENPAAAAAYDGKSIDAVWPSNEDGKTMADATVTELINNAPHPLLSYEFFPPRDEKGLEVLQRNAERLLGTNPDFVTCTWGAGGSSRERTLQVCELLREMGFSPIMPHLTCVALSADELGDIVDEIYDRGFRNIMALRGDPPGGGGSFEAPPGGFAHAAELVALIKERHPDICCGVAGYPESHTESRSLEDDIVHLKQKIDAGGDFITSQLFFDNRFYFDFVPLCRNAGIEVPILPGLLPAMSLKQMQRFMTMCGSSFPPQLALDMRHAGGTGAGAEEVGIRWAARQIEELLENHVPGVHLYVLNRSKAAMTPSVARCFERVRKRAGS
jgi:methylenetetrahydrofolate reductase (NADPH)